MKNCSCFFYFFCQIKIQLFEQAARKLHGSKEGQWADHRYARNVLTTHCNEEEHINHLTIVAARFAGWQSQEQVLILDDISWPRVQQLVRMHNQHRLPWGVNPSSCRKDILRQVKTSLLLFILDFSRGCNPKRTASYITARVAIHPHNICAGFCGALQRFSLDFGRGRRCQLNHSQCKVEAAHLGRVQKNAEMPILTPFYISLWCSVHDFIMSVSRNTLECAF